MINIKRSYNICELIPLFLCCQYINYLHDIFSKKFKQLKMLRYFFNAFKGEHSNKIKLRLNESKNNYH